MNYYIDTEFLEGTQKESFPISLFRKETKPTIDLISIGIVAEDGREYYAISKEFNLKEAWNRFDLKLHSGDGRNIGDGTYKVYWIRENVLKPIYEELVLKENRITNSIITINGKRFSEYNFTYRELKRLINKYGKTNKEIAKEIEIFTTQYSNKADEIWDKPKFYAYYADYDWVAFCWLFGKMMNLPKGFPMYCNDLKQILDEKVSVLLEKQNKRDSFLNSKNKYKSLDEAISDFKTRKDYPKQENEHNALADARWNKKLHEFLLKL